MQNLEANSKSIQPETENTGGNQTNSNASPVPDDRTDPLKTDNLTIAEDPGCDDCGSNSSPPQENA